MGALFTAKATAFGGREGKVKLDDEIIDLDLVIPSPTNKKVGSNPEQLFAAGYTACFHGALNFIAQKNKQKIDSTVTGEVSLLKDESDNPISLAVTLIANIKGVSEETAIDLVKQAHNFCPYSKALSGGNVDVKLKVIVE